MLSTIFSLCTLVLAALIPGYQSLALPNSANSWKGDLRSTSVAERESAATGTLQLSLINFLNSSNIHAYVTGQDIDNNLLILAQDGTRWITPQSNPTSITGIDIALKGDQCPLNISLPSAIYSARVWVADGYLNFSRVPVVGNGLGLVQPSVNPQDSSINTTWGFVEFSYNTSDSNVVAADLSYVDFVGMPLGIALNDSSGGSQTRYGLKKTAVSDICKALETEPPADGQPWDQLCVKDANGEPFRVLAPTHYMAKNTTAFVDYFNSTINAVWQNYQTQSFLVNTQSPFSDANCTTAPDGSMTCTNDEFAYKQPTAADIFSCNSGDFANNGGSDVHQRVYPRLCAAWNRGAMMSPVQPSAGSTYYPNDTTIAQNWYSRIVHENLSGGQGYGISFDDNYMDGDQDPSGLIKAEDPTSLTIWVGGHPNA